MKRPLFAWSRVTRGTRLEKIQRQLAPISWRKVAELEWAETFAMQREHGGAARGEHASHLMIATFGQCYLGLAWRDDAQLRRCARLFLSGQQERATGEQRHELSR